MPEEKHTRCPVCATVFRVTAEQLAMRAGQVRCGQCKTVFDGSARQVSLTPSSRPDKGATPIDEAAQDPPASAPSPSRVRETSLEAAETAGTTETTKTEASAETTEPAGTAGTAEATAPAETAETPSARLVGAVAALEAREDRLAPAAGAKPGSARAVAYTAGIVLLVLIFIGQAAFHFRDAIATFWPATRPAIARLCAAAGCAVRPLRDAAMAHLSIEASDLQADPAHKGLLILTATVRNGAGWPLAYPHLELTLTDAQDRVVVRRALAPAEYAGGTADLEGGIAPNGEVALKVFIDASATSQAGYRLYMFYP
jgi:predicted Zn finger-like uncharacterized protein